MNLNALERLARQALALQSADTRAHAGTMRYALTGAEAEALRSDRWQTAAPLGRDEDARRRDVVADVPEMGGWF
jgi:hypothetical protein